MSVVYEAKHVHIGRRVAIKVLHREMAGDAEVVARFLNEARAVGTFGHPNIVASTDFGELQGHVPYLVLEYLEGQTLQQEIADEGPLPFRRLARIAVQIASALEAAHARNVVHRDLTSSNIFLVKRPDDPDHIKVLDFGISKFLEASDATPKTRRGLTMGTPEFMAPEQICDPDAVDSRVDIYALGVILYHMLDGQYPFTRTPLQALLTQIVVEPPPPLRRQGVPPDLQVILAKALAKNPLDRFPSMREMGWELDQVATRITSKPFEVADDRLRGEPAVVSGGTPRLVAGQAASISAEMARAVLPARPGTTGPAVVETSTARISVARSKSFDLPVATQAAAGSSFAAGGHRKLAFAALVTALGAVGGVAVLLLRQPVAAPPAEPATPAVTAAPAPARPAPVPAPVRVNVSSPTTDARLTLRGRTYRLPFTEEISAGSQPEIVEVTAPGREGRRFWITLDRPIDLAAALPVGKGATEASAEETVIALGGKAIAEATGPDPSPASSSPGERGRPHRASSAQPRVPADPGASLVPARMTGHAKTRREPSEAPREPRPVPPPKAAVESAPKTPPTTTAPTAEANITAPVPSPAPSPVASGNSASQPQKARAPALATRPPAAATPTPASRGLDPARTQAMVRARLPEVQRCYERGKMDDPDLRGRVTIRISVSPAGAVMSAAVESSSLRSSSVESCIVGPYKGGSFLPPSEDQP